MYFRPVLPDGRRAPLPWQVRSVFFKLVWPLRDDPQRWMQIADTACICVTLWFLAFIAEACIHFFVANINQIMTCTDALATFLVYNDTIVRILNMTYHKKSFKNFVQRFYREIYIDEKENPELNRKIRRSIKATDMFAYSYLFAIVTFFSGPIYYAIVDNTRSLPHQVTLHYDIGNPIVYGFTLAIPILNDMCIVLVLGGELCLLGNFVGHLCGRYSMLRSELQAGEALLLRNRNVPPGELAQRFRLIVKKGVKRAQQLNGFAFAINKTYSFRIFSMTAHSGVMLCILIFQTTALDFNSAKFAYVGWMVGKLLEVIIFGNLGSRLITTTNDLSLMFYECNWESIVSRSTNRVQNVLLMRDIRMAVLLYQKPLELNGLGFFNVSLTTAASIIRLAGSYFTFLRTFQ